MRNIDDFIAHLFRFTMSAAGVVILLLLLFLAVATLVIVINAGILICKAGLGGFLLGFGFLGLCLWILTASA